MGTHPNVFGGFTAQMPAVTLADVCLTLEGREGETIASTMMRAGFTMRLACRSGGCGQCQVHLDEGITTYKAAVAEAALPPPGYYSEVILACRAVPQGDVTISVPPEGQLRCIAPILTPFALQRLDRQQIHQSMEQ